MTRFLMYSHDTYGLGHFRRSSLIASGLVGADVDNEVLIVTGSPRAHAFRLPDRVDTVKLPSATKDPAGWYRPRKLGGDLGQLVALRSSIVTSAAAAYEPDVIVVDHAPVGMGGELRPLIDLVDRQPHRPRLVLGLRDIIDDASCVAQAWERDDVWSILDAYDDVLVYGDPSVVTTASELGLEHVIGAKITHTGYVAPTMPEPLTNEPFLLVTPGGGGDGQLLLRRFLDGAEDGATAGLRSVIVTGPLLSSSRRAELLVRADRLPSVELVEFSDRMRSLIASAVGVISMAGYNTVVEELAAGTPALLVPRRWPRSEQDIRARRLSTRTQLHHTPLESLTARRIRDFVENCQSPPATSPDAVDLGGVGATVASLHPSPTQARTPTHAQT